MRALFLFLHVSLLVVLSSGKTKSSAGGQKLAFGQLSTVDLESASFDGDILFDIEWPGIEAKEQELQVLYIPLLCMQDDIHVCMLVD